MTKHAYLDLRERNQVRKKRDLWSKVERRFRNSRFLAARGVSCIFQAQSAKSLESAPGSIIPISLYPSLSREKGAGRGGGRTPTHADKCVRYSPLGQLDIRE